MDGHKIKVVLEGRPQDGGHVRLSNFLAFLGEIHKSLKETDRLIADKLVTDYRITDLSHSSPAAAVIEAFPIDASQKDQSEEVLHRFFDGLHRLSAKAAPPTWASTALLAGWREALKPVKRSLIKTGSITWKGQTVTLDRDLYETLDSVLRVEPESYGTVEGELLAVDLHQKRRKVFTLFSDIGPKKVRCIVPSRLEQQALDCLRKHVRVHGKLKYKASGPHPVEVEVDSLETVAGWDESPSLGELTGIAPDATGNASSEEYVRSLRDEW